MVAKRQAGKRERKLVTDTVQPSEPVEEEAAVEDEPDEETDEPQAPEPVPPDDGATAFGDQQRAWATVEISEDGQTATLTSIALNGWQVTARDLANDLAEAFGLRGRFDGKVLRQLIEQAQVEPVRGEFPVARGTPAEPGADGTVEFKVVSGSESPVNDALKADFAAALAGTDIDAILAAVSAGITVAPGQVVARLEPPTQGTEGRNVRGESVMQPGAQAELVPGNNTHLDADQLIADVFGYVRRAGSSFEVIPPVWVSPDASQAHLIHFPELQTQDRYEPQWVQDCLQAAGVTHGVDEEAIAALCADWPAAGSACSFLLASGSAPEDGVDASIDFEVDPTKKAGAVREDGSIDFRERNAAAGVSAGQVIGRLIAATKGVAGVDVAGTEIPAKDGEDRSFTAGANVSSRSEDGVTVFISEEDGAVSFSSDTIEVQPIYAVSGDVDYETGNINVPTSVEITGSVKSEFTVRSGGSVVIGGVLEPGCQVIAEGDVVIANGMFGDTTRVVAGGNLETKMIQNSQATVDGDVTVGSYIYSAVVRAGGTITVADGGGDRAGSIVGGDVVAGSAIVASAIGSAETDRTRVGIGATPQQNRAIADAEREIQEGRKEVAQIASSLGLPDTTEAAIEARRRRTRSSKELDEVKSQIKRMEAAQRLQTQAQEKLSAAQNEVTSCMAAGRVRAGIVHRDVYVEFEGQVNRVGGPMKEVEFHLTDAGVRWRPASD